MSETKIDFIEEEADYDKEEVLSAKEVVQFLTKTAKTLKIYLPNNPIHQKFVNSLFEKIVAHLDEYGPLRFRIKRFELLCSGQVVYENLNRLDSLAFKFYIDGLREISFHPGIEKKELISFLKIVGEEEESDQEGVDDDMATLLWEKHLSHVEYILVDDLQGDVDAIAQCKEMRPKPPKPQALNAVYNQEVNVPPSKLSPQGVTVPPLHIFQLTEDEIAALKRELRWEEEIDIVSELEGMLFDILRIEKKPDRFLEVLEILDNILEELMFKGDFSHARKILEFFWEMLDPSQNLPSELEVLLQKALIQAGNEKRIIALDAVLDRLSSDETDRFLSFMMLFQKEVISPVIELLPLVKSMKVRRLLCDVLVELGQVDLQPILSRLNDKRWFVLRNLIYVLGKIGDEEVIDHLSRFVDHEEVKVRKETLHVLDRMKDPAASVLMIKFIADLDLSNRVYAIKSLVKKEMTEGLPTLLALIESEDFDEKALYEKKEIFIAVAKLGGDEVVAAVGYHLHSGWRLFKNIQMDERGLCAALALQRIASPAAIDALREGSQTRNKAIRASCLKALGVLGIST